MTQETDLTGKILIAMPGMRDPRFARSVVLICAHGDEGAMGIVLNKPLPGIGFADLLGQLGIDAEGLGPAAHPHARGFQFEVGVDAQRHARRDVGVGMYQTERISHRLRYVCP